MTRSEARYQNQTPGGRATHPKPAETLSRGVAGILAPPSPWQHECRLNKHQPASTARLHTIPFTRVPTGLIAACPYCGTVKHEAKGTRP